MRAQRPRATNRGELPAPPQRGHKHANDPAVNAAWKEKYIADDPPRSHNVRGSFAFSFKAMPNTRNTQIYINLADKIIREQ